MTDTTTAWLKSGEYLPSFMRDFHDQKDVFKAVDEVMQRSIAKNDGSYMRDLSWVDCHVYTVDVFLWMMARHGYTLQRSRKRVLFADLYEWLSGAKARRGAEMARALFGRPSPAECGASSPAEGRAGTLAQDEPLPPSDS